MRAKIFINLFPHFSYITTYEQIDFSAFFVTDRELSNLKGRSVPHTPWKIWIVICTMEMKTEFVEHFIFRGNAFRARNREEFRNCTMSERTKHGKKKELPVPILNFSGHYEITVFFRSSLHTKSHYMTNLWPFQHAIKVILHTKPNRLFIVLFSCVRIVESFQGTREADSIQTW